MRKREKLSTSSPLVSMRNNKKRRKGMMTMNRRVKKTYPKLRRTTTKSATNKEKEKLKTAGSFLLKMFGSTLLYL